MVNRGLFLSAIAGVVAFYSVSAQAAGCVDAARDAEQRFRIPRGLLNAVAHVESQMGGAPNPFALNINGQAYYPETAKTALGAIQNAVAVGQTGMAIGCMQIRYDFHLRHFRSAGEMLEAGANVRYAARFLRSLHDWLGSWDRALSYYNTGQDSLSLAYVCRVAARLDPDLGQQILGAAWKQCGLKSAREDGMKRPRGPLLMLVADRGWDGLSVVEPGVPGNRFRPLADKPEARPVEEAGAKAEVLQPSGPTGGPQMILGPTESTTVAAPTATRALSAGQVRSAPVQYNAATRTRPASVEGPTRAALLAPPPPPAKPVIEDAAHHPDVPHFAHLASYGDRESAVSGWHVLQRRFPGVVGDLAPVVQDVKVSDGKTAYRLLVGAFPSRGDADAFCRQFKDPAQYCQPRP